MLVPVLEFNAPAVPDRMNRIAQAMGATDGDATGAVRRLIAGLPMPARLSEAGVGDEMLPELVRQAEADSCKATNPRPVGRDDLERLYRAAM
jgi:alcohol dehydrogenase class IV